MHTPTWWVRTIVVCVLALYSMRLVWGRSALFWRAWVVEGRAHRDAQAKFADCSANAHRRTVWNAECQQAERALETWPIVGAFGTLMENTYLCVEVPCSTLLGSVAAALVSTWYGLLFWCAAALAIALAVSAIAAQNSRPRGPIWEAVGADTVVRRPAWEEQPPLCRQRHVGPPRVQELPPPPASPYLWQESAV